eukprot:g83311.t1
MLYALNSKHFDYEAAAVHVPDKRLRVRAWYFVLWQLLVIPVLLLEAHWHHQKIPHPACFFSRQTKNTQPNRPGDSLGPERSPAPGKRQVSIFIDPRLSQSFYTIYVKLKF